MVGGAGVPERPRDLALDLGDGGRRLYAIGRCDVEGQFVAIGRGVTQQAGGGELCQDENRNQECEKKFQATLSCAGAAMLVRVSTRAPPRSSGKASHASRSRNGPAFIHSSAARTPRGSPARSTIQPMSPHDHSSHLQQDGPRHEDQLLADDSAGLIRLMRESPVRN